MVNKPLPPSRSPEVSKYLNQKAGKFIDNGYVNVFLNTIVQAHNNRAMPKPNVRFVSRMALVIIRALLRSRFASAYTGVSDVSFWLLLRKVCAVFQQ